MSRGAEEYQSIEREPHRAVRQIVRRYRERVLPARSRATPKYIEVSNEAPNTFVTPTQQRRVATKIPPPPPQTTMGTIAEMFRLGGIWMYAVFALTIMLSPAFIVGVALFGLSFTKQEGRKKKRFIAAGLCLGTAVVLLVVGGLGWHFGIAEMQNTLELVSPEDRESLRQRGRIAAIYPLQFAGVAAILPAVAGLVALVAGWVGDDEPS